MVRRTYVTHGRWWKRDRFFMHYMAREATAPFVVAYAVVLLGLVRLSQGEGAFEYLPGSQPGLDRLHGAFAIFLSHLHLVPIMPKTLPPITVAGKRVGPGRLPWWDGGVGGVVAGAALLIAGARRMRRSTQPIFWLLFGAGGCSALVGAALVPHRNCRPLGARGFAAVMTYANVSSPTTGEKASCAVVALFIGTAAPYLPQPARLPDSHRRSRSRLLRLPSSRPWWPRRRCSIGF
jgi:fumarate reductase subunit C